MKTCNLCGGKIHVTPAIQLLYCVKCAEMKTLDEITDHQEMEEEE